MYQISIINDPGTGFWYRNLGHIKPFMYSVLIRYVDEDISTEVIKYHLKGLDMRVFDTKPKAIQEARYRLGLENKPCEWDEEQQAAMRAYNKAMVHYDNAAILIERQVFVEGTEDTDTTLNMTVRRQRIKDAYLAAKLIGVHMAGEVPS